MNVDKAEKSSLGCEFKNGFVFCFFLKGESCDYICFLKCKYVGYMYL